MRNREGGQRRGRVYTKHKCPSRKRDSFILPNTYFSCSYYDTALSSSWLAQPDFPGAWYHVLNRGTGARQTALFIGRIRGRLSLKELGRLAGGIHHNAVGIAIRCFTQRLQSDRTLLEKVALVQRN